MMCEKAGSGLNVEDARFIIYVQFENYKDVPLLIIIITTTTTLCKVYDFNLHIID